jgi:hypothetical protein
MRKYSLYLNKRKHTRNPKFIVDIFLYRITRKFHSILKFALFQENSRNFLDFLWKIESGRFTRNIFQITLEFHQSSIYNFTHFI